MITAVDTQVFLDVLLADPRFGTASAAALDRARREGSLVIGEVVYAELATRFPSRRELSRFLAETGVALVESSREALWRAGSAWKQYAASRRGTAELRCPGCGQAFLCSCPGCGRTVAWRQHVIADFLIGAHAWTHADRLLTRDVAYFRRWFPELKLCEPGAAEE